MLIVQHFYSSHHSSSSTDGKCISAQSVLSHWQRTFQQSIHIYRNEAKRSETLNRFQFCISFLVVITIYAGFRLLCIMERALLVIHQDMHRQWCVCSRSSFVCTDSAQLQPFIVVYTTALLLLLLLLLAGISVHTHKSINSIWRREGKNTEANIRKTIIIIINNSE